MSHNSTKHMYTCPAELCCASIGKYEQNDKSYGQLGNNVTTNLVVTTKFVLTAPTTKLIVLAYF